jgi:putative phage-type endonuclease
MLTQTTTPTETALEPGSPEWRKTMSASKVAAALSFDYEDSPYDSPLSLWLQMAGLDPGEGDTAAKRRGHYLEAGIADWFADEHPDWQITGSLFFRHSQHEWATATPDRIVTTDTNRHELLEMKTDRKGVFGKPGTDEIPVYYRVQGIWQMIVSGLRRVHFAVLSPWLDTNAYVLDWDQAEADYVLEKAAGFMDSLPWGAMPCQPPTDGHPKTLPSMLRAHAFVATDEPVEIPREVARGYLGAYVGHKDAETAKRAAAAALLDAVGAGKRATCEGQTIATISAASETRRPALTPNNKAVKEFRA